MYFEINNFDGTNSDIIEIVSSVFELGLLRRSGNKNVKVCLPLSLSIGKLDSTNPFNRKVLSKYCTFDNSFDFTYDFDKLKSIVNDSTKIRVWSSHLNCDDYCLLLLICYLFQDKEISVIFSEELSWGVPTIGAACVKEILELERKEHILKKYEIEDYCNQWKRVVNDNKELRYMINGSVVSCNIDRFDTDIINRLKKLRKTYLYKLIGDLMGNPTIPYVFYADWVYAYLIERLEKNGIIKSYLIDNKKYIEIVKQK